MVRGPATGQLQLRFSNHLRPQRTRIRIENRSGVRRENEPPAELHFLPQLIVRPSRIAQINMKNLRVGPGRKGLFEESLRGNQVNATEDALSPFDLGWRPEKRKRRRNFDRAPEIRRVGTVFRALETLKHP